MFDRYFLALWHHVYTSFKRLARQASDVEEPFTCDRALYHYVSRYRSRLYREGAIPSVLNAGYASVYRVLLSNTSSPQSITVPLQALGKVILVDGMAGVKIWGSSFSSLVREVSRMRQCGESGCMYLLRHRGIPSEQRFGCRVTTKTCDWN